MKVFALSLLAGGALALQLRAADVAGPPPSEPPPPPATVAPVQPPDGPRMKFDSMIHDFGRIGASETVKHIFYFTNVGNQTLYLTNVQVTCGCTTAGAWTREVPPGGTGSIPLQFTGGSFNGPVQKTVGLNSNDRAQPGASLQLKATVWRPVEVNPQYAVLNLAPDALGATNSVRIINNSDEPLIVFPPESNNKAFIAELRTNQPGKEYQVIVAALAPLPPGSSSAQINLRTSSTNVPVATVTALAYSQPPVQVMPAQVGLPATMPNQLTSSITILNNTTNKMTISEPVVNSTNITVQFREVQPGRSFVAALTFPTGFTIQPGEQLAFTAKSDHPRMPEIRVPIFQMPPTAAAPRTPVGATARIVPPRPATLPAAPPPAPPPAQN